MKNEKKLTEANASVWLLLATALTKYALFKSR